MLGGLGAYLTSEVSGVVRRNVVVYGLFGFAALLVFCAGGYGLHALHTILERHYGSVAASLSIAGGLLFVALVAFVSALMVKRRRRPPRPAATAALAAAPIAMQLMGSRIGWRALALGGVVIVGAVLGRQIFSGDAESDADDG